MNTLRSLIVVAVLGLIVTYQAGAVWQKMSAPPIDLRQEMALVPDTPVDTPEITPQGPSGGTTPVQQQEIIALALFEPTRQTPSPDLPAPAAEDAVTAVTPVTEEAPLDAVLLGTVLQEANSFAVLKLNGTQIITIQVGTVVEGWRLAEITPDTARFVRDDKETLLELLLQ